MYYNINHTTCAMQWKTHFSSCESPLHFAEHHHRWLETLCIHAKSPSQPLALAFAASFLPTPLLRCHTSNWWSIWKQTNHTSKWKPSVQAKPLVPSIAMCAGPWVQLRWQSRSLQWCVTRTTWKWDLSLMFAIMDPNNKAHVSCVLLILVNIITFISLLKSGIIIPSKYPRLNMRPSWSSRSLGGDLSRRWRPPCHPQRWLGWSTA